jgi:hypothetical protein
VSSRGHFIGQIIDDLDAIASQVKARCALGQSDLNRVLEDFFKELLNLVHGSNLRNLNSQRSNEPGLDLGDSTSDRKIAYQVTSQADASKVNKTLEKITADQLKIYDEIRVLIIGKRQKTYSLKKDLVTKCRFNERNIIGTTELCRDIMDLNLETIQAVHRKLSDEQRRIRIELEPEIDGKFATTASTLLEGRPSVIRSDGTLLYAHSDADGLFGSLEEVTKALNGYIDKLQTLPRLTREFYGWLIDNSDYAMDVGEKAFQTNADYVEAKGRAMGNLMSEIRLLQAWGFLDFDEDESHKSTYIRPMFPGIGRKSSLGEAILCFFKSERLSAATMFSTMNFSALGPRPVDGTPPAQPSNVDPKSKKSKDYDRSH